MSAPVAGLSARLQHVKRVYHGSSVQKRATTVTITSRASLRLTTANTGTTIMMEIVAIRPNLQRGRCRGAKKTLIKARHTLHTREHHGLSVALR